MFIVTPERGEGLARYTLEQVKDRALTKVGKKGSPPPPPQVEQLRALYVGGCGSPRWCTIVPFSLLSLLLLRLSLSCLIFSFFCECNVFLCLLTNLPPRNHDARLLPVTLPPGAAAPKRPRQLLAGPRRARPAPGRWMMSRVVSGHSPHAWAGFSSAPASRERRRGAERAPPLPPYLSLLLPCGGPWVPLHPPATLRRRRRGYAPPCFLRRLAALCL